MGIKLFGIDFREKLRKKNEILAFKRMHLLCMYLRKPQKVVNMGTKLFRIDSRVKSGHKKMKGLKGHSAGFFKKVPKRPKGPVSRLFKKAPERKKGPVSRLF